jgi:hypothetical protein
MFSKELRMKIRLLVVASAIVPMLALAAESPLFTQNMAVDIMGGGERSFMRFEEVERGATSSVARVTGVTPVSRLNDRFILMAMCGLAKARSAAYFQARQVSADPLTFEIGFPEAGPAQPGSDSFPTNATAPNVFPASSCP